VVTIRRATVQDAPALDRLNVRLLQAALAWVSEPEAEGTAAITYQELYCEQMPDEHLDGLRPEEQAAGWEQGLRRNRDRDPVLVAEEAGRVVGFAVVGPAQDPEGAGELYAINVDPDRWGTGAGRALLAAAQAELARLGYAEAVLWVLPDNARARRFYEVAGWTTDGTQRSSEVRGVVVPEVCYRRRLQDLPSKA
jgi:L-amino acid N-acyltransferase YncA